MLVYVSYRIVVCTFVMCVFLYIYNYYSKAYFTFLKLKKNSLLFKLEHTVITVKI